jgi:hypothetical protein
LGIFDASGGLRLVYSAPVIRLPSGKTVTPDLEWDEPSASISVSLPELSFPLIIAFGLGVKFPDTKGGFHLNFPSFKFGAKGEIEDSDSDSDDDEKKKKGGFGFGIKAPKFGFGHSEKGDVDIAKPDVSGSGKIKVIFVVNWPFLIRLYRLVCLLSHSSSPSSSLAPRGPSHCMGMWISLTSKSLMDNSQSTSILLSTTFLWDSALMAVHTLMHLIGNLPFLHSTSPYTSLSCSQLMDFICCEE